MKSIINFIYLPCDFTAKRKPLPLEVVYNISKKINSKAMPLKAFWLGNHHLLCRWSFTAKRKQPSLEVVYNISKRINSKAMPLKAFWLFTQNYNIQHL